MAHTTPSSQSHVVCEAEVSKLCTPIDEPLNGRDIYAKSLHGLLFNITGQADRQESDWLHASPSPRPFSLVPLYSEDGFLAGIRLAALSERAASLFQRTGDWFCKTQRPCHIGGREFFVSDYWSTPSLNWQQLAMNEPVSKMGLRFVSPTAFKQGPGHLPLPLPANVFGSSAKIWQAFAPSELPEEWLEWCQQDIFIIQHNIETVKVTVSRHQQFTGFVGDVWFEAFKGSHIQRRAWSALGTLAAFCGVGHMTTMGMSAVELLA